MEAYRQWFVYFRHDRKEDYIDLIKQLQKAENIEVGELYVPCKSEHHYSGL